RGFSFKNDGPLDMRMSQEGTSAADIINRGSEQELADLLYHYGEDKASRRLAHAIVEARMQSPITNICRLAVIVRAAVGGMHHKTDSATRSLQELRIYVNQELDAIENGLKDAETLLAPGGRLVAVSFHSLEDRIVKQF